MFVTITEAATLLGLSRGTVWKRVIRRKVPYRKVGNVALIPLGDIQFRRR